jgi:hypothetical protein
MRISQKLAEQTFDLVALASKSAIEELDPTKQTHGVEAPYLKVHSFLASLRR